MTAALPGRPDVVLDLIDLADTQPRLDLASYDLASVGYRTQEFCMSGTADAFELAVPPSDDGAWTARPARSAPFRTRLLVARPVEEPHFNGTVVVEWLNVTAGQDTPMVWYATHREIVRSGTAYVAVSAQHIGVEGDGDGPPGLGGIGLKRADPARYGALSHPGDAFAYDIFSVAGAVVREPRSGLLDGLVAGRVIAAGESQSAAFLTTYVNAIDPVAQAYDGYLVHSRFGSAAAIDGSYIDGTADVPRFVRCRDDVRVPVLTVVTESDVLGARLDGYHGARSADHDLRRTWEIAGTAHGDNYLFGGAAVDSGSLPLPELASIFLRPVSEFVARIASRPFNTGEAHHYVINTALRRLDEWVRGGPPPTSAPALELDPPAGGPGSVRLVRDTYGIALGGVRTPWVDVPTRRLTGIGTRDGSLIDMLAGTGEALDRRVLDQLYPGGEADYLDRFGLALDDALRRGVLLHDDRDEILGVAALHGLHSG